jgi:small subunit ribosomal protein S29
MNLKHPKLNILVALFSSKSPVADRLAANSPIMASSLCGSCRLRLRPSHYTPFSAQLLLSGTPHRAPFHSSAAQHAAPAKKSSRGQPGQQLKFREPMASRMKPRPKPTKPPRMTPQERRAMKQPVSISNANALVVPDAKPLSLEDMADESMHGKMLALPPTLLDRLRALGAFAESSDWRMFKIPTTLVRRETLELGRLFGAIAGGPEGTDRRRVARIVSGARGTGKSVHLLQAMTMGLLSDWVVINVPNGMDFFNPSIKARIQKILTLDFLQRGT